MKPTVRELGELGLLSELLGSLRPAAAAEVGPGDDAAVLAVPGGRVVASTDVVVEGRHFRRDWSEAVDVGHKVAAQNLADVVATGAEPIALLVGLAVPGDLPVDWVRGLYEGLQAECALLDESGAAGGAVGVVGGDLVEADAISVSVTALGQLTGPPVLRSGGVPGDVVAVAGRVGWAAAGLSVLRRGFRSPRALVAAHRRPEVPYAAGLAASTHGVHAMTDVSDGLVADLAHLARASGVAVDLRAATLEVPAAMVQVAGALGVEPLDWLLGGGDDHAFVGFFPEAPPEPWWVVGTVADRTEGAPLVTVDGAGYADGAGHTHFS